MPSRMTTTSLPSSTRRLAFSIASSATWVCSSLGRSNVEEMTSPLTVRRMSVTSSGRSSMSSTMSLTSGLFGSIDLAIVFMTVVLPALGGDTMMPRWPLPIGDTRSMMRAVMLVGSVGSSRRQPLVGEQRGEVLEAGAALGRLGIAAVDGVDLEQRRVLLVATGRPAEAGDVVALAQAVLAGELDRDVGVVAARQVALDAQEAVALVADVEVARRPSTGSLLGDRRLGHGSASITRDRRRPADRRPAAVALAPTAPATVARLAVALGLTARLTPSCVATAVCAPTGPSPSVTALAGEPASLGVTTGVGGARRHGAVRRHDAGRGGRDGVGHEVGGDVELPLGRAARRRGRPRRVGSAAPSPLETRVAVGRRHRRWTSGVTVDGGHGRPARGAGPARRRSPPAPSRWSRGSSR